MRVYFPDRKPIKYIGDTPYLFHHLGYKPYPELKKGDIVLVPSSLAVTLTRRATKLFEEVEVDLTVVRKESKNQVVNLKKDKETQ